MPLFMDIHKKVDGATPEAVAGAHARDLEVGARYGVKYLNTGSTNKMGRSSAWWRHPTGRLPARFITRLMAWWPMKFTRYQKTDNPFEDEIQNSVIYWMKHAAQPHVSSNKSALLTRERIDVYQLFGIRQKIDPVIAFDHCIIGVWGYRQAVLVNLVII